MKIAITAIEAHVCNARMRNWIFIKIYTDVDGLVGWGEATLEWHTREVVAAIEDMKELLIGEDASRIEFLWQKMFRQHFWHGSGVVRATAISGIDIALWDIVGKYLGVPCYQLWGGAVREYIRTYAHLGGGRMEDFYKTPVDNAQRFADLALEAVDSGFTAIKCMAVPSTAPVEGIMPVNAAEKCVSAIRNAVGPEIDIMVDCHARPSPAMGMRFAKALDDYGLYFLEEPCWPERVADLARINQATKTPVATGERLTDLSQFNAVLQSGGCGVCQPDITHCGGLSQARRIAALAETYRIALAPHNPQGPVSTAASLQFGFSQPSYVICETVTDDVPWRSEVVEEGYTVEKEDRIVRAGNQVGLGVEINESAIARHPFAPEEPMQEYLGDGSVADW